MLREVRTYLPSLVPSTLKPNNRQFPQLPMRYQWPFPNTRNKPSLRARLLHLSTNRTTLQLGGCLARQPHFFTASKTGRCPSALSPPSCLILSTNNPSGGESFLVAADKVSSSPLTCKSAFHSHFPHIRITATISDSKSHTLLSRPSCQKSSTSTLIGPRWTCLMPVMILPLVAWVLTGEIFFLMLANEEGEGAYYLHFRRHSPMPRRGYARTPLFNNIGLLQMTSRPSRMKSKLSPMILICLATLSRRYPLGLCQPQLEQASRRNQHMQ